jgi:hypothetical protein
MSVPQTLRAFAAPARPASRLATWAVPALLLGAATASAQQDITLQKAPTEAQYAGVYHVQSGTWTRRTSQLGPSLADIIYSNTAPSTYFSSAGATGGFAPGSTNFDEGGLPGLTNGHPFAVGPDRDTYRVNGFQINYCDFGAPMSGGWEISFYESYAPCTADFSPVASITTTGLPAGGGCWLIDIDLTGAEEFDIVADGGDSWQDDPNVDSFGWSHRYAGSDPGSFGGAGFFLSGDPGSTDVSWVPGEVPIEGNGTYYGGPSVCLGNTGYLIQDFWWLEDPNVATNSGCYFFGGYFNLGGCDTGANPHASWHMEIYADAAASDIGTDYCQSTVNSTGAMTTLTASGSEVATDDAVELRASNMPVGVFGFYITSQSQGSVSNPGGSDGNLCVVGDVGRFMQSGQVKAADANGMFTLSTILGEWSTSSIPQATPPLNYAAMAGITSNFQLWHRDTTAGGSNFSNGLELMFQ